MAADHDLESSASPLLRNPPLNGARHTRKPSTGSIERDGSIARKRGLRTAFASIAGLVIHAVADGIAMGASAGSGDESLKLIVFFAIMIHKAVSENKNPTPMTKQLTSSMSSPRPLGCALC